LTFEFPLCGGKKFDELVISLPNGTDGIHPQLESALKARGVWTASREIWLVSVVRGNTYNVHGLLELDQPFDFVHPGMPSLSIRRDAQLLPYDAVREVFRRNSHATRRFFRCLPRHNILGVLHLEAPPPIPDRDHCYNTVERLMLAKSLGRSENVRISPREFRMKLWRTQSDVTQEVCSENNVIYVTPPEQGLDEHGYLKPEGWHGATHGSTWYGALVLRKIESVIAANRRP
jgi:hypothetical protein